MPARVHNSQSLLDTKFAIIKFIDSIHAAMASVDSEVSRTTQWLNQDRIPHWKRELRRREDHVQVCKNAIAAKQLARMPDPADTTLERRALRRAEDRVESARRRLEASKRWAPVWEREAANYKMGCSKLSDSLHRDLPNALARLEAMVLALERYEALAAPNTDLGHALESLPPPPENQP